MSIVVIATGGREFFSNHQGPADTQPASEDQSPTQVVLDPDLPGRVRHQGTLNTLRIVVFRAICTMGLLAALATPLRPQSDEQLVADLRMFTVMAAINAAGYDDGLNAEAVSPVRLALREDLASMDRGMRSRLETFYEQHRQSDPDLDLSQYVSFALTCGAPPYFDLRAEVPTDLPVDIRKIRGMSALLREFYEVVAIEQLWEKFRPAYEAEILRYQDSLVKAVFEINGYLRMPSSSRETRGFRVYFDLLAAPGNINMRSYGGDVKIVIHSSGAIREEEIRAAYLLHQLDRLSIRYADAVSKKEGLSRFAIFAPALDNAYKTNFQLLVTKSLAHAMQVRMRYEAEERKLQRINEHLRHGFILAPYFYEKLAEYEKQPQAFPRYYETLVGDINMRQEAARIQGVRFAERTPAKAPAPRRVAKPKVSEEESLLAQAEGLLQLNELDEARRLFDRVLSGDGPGRGQASYGLGRIALDEADPDLALEHFAAAVEVATDIRIQAMSHVYMGRIQDILGNRDLALGHYRSALSSGDTSPIIRQFAEQGLNEAFTGVEDSE